MPAHGSVRIKPDKEVSWDQFQNTTLREVDRSQLVDTWPASEKLIRHFELAIRKFCEAYDLK
jgi:hypothetical protein